MLIATCPSCHARFKMGEETFIALKGVLSCPECEKWFKISMPSAAPKKARPFSSDAKPDIVASNHISEDNNNQKNTSEGVDTDQKTKAEPIASAANPSDAYHSDLMDSTEIAPSDLSQVHQNQVYQDQNGDDSIEQPVKEDSINHFKEESEPYSDHSINFEIEEDQYFANGKNRNRNMNKALDQRLAGFFKQAFDQESGFEKNTDLSEFYGLRHEPLSRTETYQSDTNPLLFTLGENMLDNEMSYPQKRASSSLLMLCDVRDQRQEERLSEKVVCAYPPNTALNKSDWLIPSLISLIILLMQITYIVIIF